MLIQLSWTAYHAFKVVRVSAISNFKTEAIPMLKSRDKNLFVVGYFFDASKGLHDLSKVSIKFPKKVLDHPNCIKHLEIKGNIDLNALAASQDFSISGNKGWSRFLPNL